MARRSAKARAKEARKKPQPRKRVAQVRTWGWSDVAWVGIALLIASILTVLLLGNRFTAMMPDEGVVGVRIVLLIVFYLALLMILAYRAHCRNLNFAEAYRLRKANDDELKRRRASLWVKKNKEGEGKGLQTGGKQSKQQEFLAAWQSALLVIGLFIALRTFAIVYTYVTRELGWVTPPAESLTDLFGTTMFGLAAAIISIVILAPFIEELVFRVIMFDTFAQKMPIVVAAVLQGLVFSLYHFSLWAALPNFMLALACVYLIQKCRTAFPAILLHVFYNAAVVAAAFYIAMV